MLPVAGDPVSVLAPVTYAGADQILTADFQTGNGEVIITGRHLGSLDEVKRCAKS
jgi:hypothetical protein